MESNKLTSKHWCSLYQRRDFIETDYNYLSIQYLALCFPHLILSLTLISLPLNFPKVEHTIRLFTTDSVDIRIKDHTTGLLDNGIMFKSQKLLNPLPIGNVHRSTWVAQIINEFPNFCSNWI